MQKTFRITVEGRAYVVTVEDISTEGGQNLYPEPGIMTAAATVATPDSSDTPPSASAVAAEAKPGDEVSPLAGVVQTLHVGVGDTVAVGDQLVSLEAMKMVTHVIAKHSGKVAAIAVKPGDPVDVGQVLLTIE